MSKVDKEYFSKYRREAYRKNPAKFIARRKVSVQKYRTAVLTLLGDVCCQCGYSQRPALQIDHVRGGGKEQFRKLGNTEKYYKHIIQQLTLGSKEYQLLCANCNQLKRHNNGESKTRRKPVNVIAERSLFDGDLK
jgi:hypothetical protein